MDAHWDDHVVRTDQAREDGGEGAEPSPLALFFASLATCAGISALSWCRKRNLATDGLGISLEAHYDEAEGRYTRVLVDVRVPAGFPEELRGDLQRRVDGCAVKRHILQPPVFESRISAGA